MTTVPLRTALANLAPAPTAVINFVNSTATVEGASVTFADQIANDPDFGGSVDLANVVAGHGLAHSATSTFKTAGAVEAHMLAQTNLVVMLEAVLVGTSTLLMNFYEPVNWDVEQHLLVGGSGGGVLKRYVTGDWWYANCGKTYSLGTYTNTRVITRAAMLITPEFQAGVTVGGYPAALSRADEPTPASNRWTFAIEADVRLRKIAIYGGVNDMTTLSTLTAIGIV